MSDQPDDNEDDEVEGVMFISPADLVKGLRIQHDRHHAMMEDEVHGMERFIGELGEEHLASLKAIVGSIAGSSDPSGAAGYWLGRCSSELSHRFGICAGCGRNHAKEEAEFMENAAKAAAAGSDPTPEGMVERVTDAVTRLNRELELRPALFGYEWMSDVKDIMTLYRIDDAYAEDTGAFLGFTCTGCGTMYPTIKDRMLSEPDACHGCFEKSAHG